MEGSFPKLPAGYRSPVVEGIDAYRDMTDPAQRRAGTFIAEGARVIAQLLESHYRVRSFLCLSAGLDRLAASGREVVALTPRPDVDAESIADLAATLDSEPIAVLLGSEADGLTEAALGAATRRARIPMTSDVDSLNVAAAAAIAL